MATADDSRPIGGKEETSVVLEDAKDACNHKLRKRKLSHVANCWFLL